jgi:hypothetical protein
VDGAQKREVSGKIANSVTPDGTVQWHRSNMRAMASTEKNVKSCERISGNKHKVRVTRKKNGKTNFFCKLFFPKLSFSWVTRSQKVLKNKKFVDFSKF